jgi:hypothetical protein
LAVQGNSGFDALGQAKVIDVPVGPPKDPESLDRLLRLVDDSLLPTVRAGRRALTESGQADDANVRTAVHHLKEVEADLVCLLASRGVWT